MGKLDPEVRALVDGVLQQLSYITQNTSKTSEMLAYGVRNGVLQSGTVVLDSTGMWTLSVGSQIGSMEVRNPGDYTVTVVPGATSTLPVQGAGVHKIGAGDWRIVNVANHCVTLFGTAGQSFSYTALTQGGIWGGGTVTSTSTAIPVTLTGANQLIAAVPFLNGQLQGTLKYKGFALRETGGVAAALVRIFDNTAASGTVLDEISLAPGESAREMYPQRGVRATIGIYAQVVSGAVAGSVRYN